MRNQESERKTRLAAWLSFLRVHSRVTAALDQELEAQELLSMSWFDVLEQLLGSPDRQLRMQELGDRLAMSASGLSRRISRMEQEGLVERRPCPEDRRGVLVVLTEIGEKRYRKALPVHLRGIEHHFLRHIDTDQAQQLATIFDDMLRALDAPDPGGFQLQEPADAS